MIGLAVMGENLAMNMESKGFTVAVYNRTTEKVDSFLSGRAAGKNFIGAHSLEKLADSLEKPRRIFMMVKAGKAVDDLIDSLLPYLEEGRLRPWIHNKTIQKAIESYRITKEQKEYLRTLKK